MLTMLIINCNRRHVDISDISPYSSMLAVNTDDFSIHVVDVELRRVVRRFTGHHNGITDMVGS